MKAVLNLLVLCFAFGAAAAYEPDVTQQREEYDPAFPNVDHLIPSGTMPPEEYGPPLLYLARFSRSPPFHEEEASEWSLIHKQRPGIREHRYVLSSWRLDRRDRNAEPRRIEIKEIEIPQELAATIYSIWANAILDARYARQPLGVDGVSYWFSTCLSGVGWFSATTSKSSRDLPPAWLAEAGEQVFALSRAEHPDVGQLQSSLKKLRERLGKHRE